MEIIPLLAIAALALCGVFAVLLDCLVDVVGEAFGGACDALGVDR